MLDLQRAQAAEDSKGAAMEKIRKAEQEVINVLNKLEQKGKKNQDLRQKQTEELKARQIEKKLKWDGKRMDIQNKEYMINPETVAVNFASLKKVAKKHTPGNSPRPGDAGSAKKVAGSG